MQRKLDTEIEKRGSRLRALREAQGKSLNDMQRATGFDKGYISKVERGLQRPSIDFLAAAARELGLKDVSSVLERFWP
jgi:transcriptional regulator with XRE-family HTH domain